MHKETAQESKNEAAVHLTKKTVIPSHSGMFLEGCVSRLGPSDRDVLLMPTVLDPLTLPYSVITLAKSRCIIWAINPPIQPVKLNCGTRRKEKWLMVPAAVLQNLWNQKEKHLLVLTRATYLVQIDMKASGINRQSWKGIGARIKRCPVEDSSTGDFEYE